MNPQQALDYTRLQEGLLASVQLNRDFLARMGGVETAITTLKGDIISRVNTVGNRLDDYLGTGTDNRRLHEYLPVMNYCELELLGERIKNIGRMRDEFRGEIAILPRSSKAASVLLTKFIDEKFAMNMSSDGRTKMPFTKSTFSGLVLQALDQFYQVPGKSAKGAVSVWLR